MIKENFRPISRALNISLYMQIACIILSYASALAVPFFFFDAGFAGSMAARIFPLFSLCGSIIILFLFLIVYSRIKASISDSYQGYAPQLGLAALYFAGSIIIGIVFSRIQSYSLSGAVNYMYQSAESSSYSVGTAVSAYSYTNSAVGFFSYLGRIGDLILAGCFGAVTYHFYIAERRLLRDEQDLS